MNFALRERQKTSGGIQLTGHFWSGESGMSLQLFDR